jgi:hypothetical protein
VKDQEKKGEKIGSGHLRGMAKLGLSELRGALYPNSNVAQPTEYGIFGKETPGEVADLRESDPKRDEERTSILGEREKTAEAKRDSAARDKSKEGEREPPRERDER